MTRVLSIANKLLSLRGRMDVTDEHGSLAYEAKGEIALISPTWRINSNEKEVASVRRKIFSLTPTWIVQCGSEEFKIKRKLFSWTRQYYAVGGSHDGTIVKGNIWDLSFKVLRNRNTIATATGNILTLRDRHNIEIVGEGELFVVISMVVMHLDRLDARKDSND